MSRLDRLSSLIRHIEIRAERRADGYAGSLGLTTHEGAPKTLALRLRPAEEAPQSAIDWLPVDIDIGGMGNPLVQALPPVLLVDLADEPQLAALAVLIQEEIRAPRCGGAFALARLCEVLILALLRHRIERHGAATGVFAGLAHPKLSRVLVAMHEAPGRAWRVDDFVPLSAMSRTHFMAEFQRVVGASPMAYLKRWRMVLAREAVLQGDRIGAVSRRYGYRSSEAFSRAFSETFGVAPTKLSREDA